MGAVLTGATLLGGALAADISDFQKMGPSDTVVVVGAAAQTSDVVGAVNVGATLYGHGATATSGGATTTTVEGGVALATSSTKINNGDYINVAKSIITKTDFPTTLADSVLKTNTSTEKKITNQRIEIGSKSIAFAKDVESADPDFYISNIGTSTSSPLYTLSATVESVNMLSAVGKKMSLFGKDFTVSDKTTTDKIVLYTSATTISLGRGESAKVTVDGVEHTIELKAVTAGSTSSSDRVSVSVDGVSDDITEGTSEKINNIDIFADKVSAYQEVVDGVALNSGDASLLIGSQQVTLQSGNSVMTGSSDTAIDGTNVYLTGGVTALTGITINVTSDDSSTDYIAQGGSFVDPIFGTFKISFGGVSAPLNSDVRDVVKVATSGTRDATVTFNDKLSGKSKTLTFAHDEASTIAAQDADLKKLQYGNAKDIAVFEGQNMTKDDYFVAYSDETSRLLQITYVREKSLTDTSDKVTIKDVLTSETLYDANSDTSATGNTFTVGSKTYTVIVRDNTTQGSEVVTIAPSGVTALATSPVTGTGVGVYNPIVLKNGAQLVLYAPITTGLNATTIVLPDGTKAGTTVNATAISAGLEGAKTYSAGPLKYQITTANWSTSTYKITGVKLMNSTGVGTLETAAAIVIENDNAMDSDDRSTKQEAHVVYVDGAIDTDKVGIAGYYYNRQTGATNSSTQSAYSGLRLESNTDKSQSSNAYGTVISYLSTGQRSVEITYPEAQMTADVYVLTSSAATPTSTTGTGNVVLPSLGSGISKLDSEISAEKTTKNLILVGGPYANTLVNELAEQAKTPTKAEWSEKLQGKAIIQAIGDAFQPGKTAIVVAGWSAEDTRTATLKLATADKTFKGAAQEAIGGVWSSMTYPFAAETNTTGY